MNERVDCFDGRQNFDSNGGEGQEQKSIKITFGQKELRVPIVHSTAGPSAIDASFLRELGLFSLDYGFANTASVESSITYIDGEKGVLKYRGIDIEDIASCNSFIEICHLLLEGKFPTVEEKEQFIGDLVSIKIDYNLLISFLDGIPAGTHPMQAVASTLTLLDSFSRAQTSRERACAMLIAVPVVIAYMIASSNKSTAFEPCAFRDFLKSGCSYSQAFLNLAFSTQVKDTYANTLDILLNLHADHEQNASTSSVRMVASTGASDYASVAAGVLALSGPLHGGANESVLAMLQQVLEEGSAHAFLERVKSRDSSVRLMGFGHRVYKNYDPRAKIVKSMANELLTQRDTKDPLLEIALEIEQLALNDTYFVQRRLYPNVDFYTGLIYRVIGIENRFFTALFALGRLPGWIAHFIEQRNDPKKRICRPRQLYKGPISGER